MSKDIRSFFQVTKPKKIIDDDSDVIPESPEVISNKNKKKQSRKKRQISDDSDEEIFSNKRANHDRQTSANSKSKSKPSLKEVKLFDVLNAGPIKRSEPLVNKSKKQSETGIHSDDDFEMSLIEIDGIEELHKNKSIKESDTAIETQSEIVNQYVSTGKDNNVVKKLQDMPKESQSNIVIEEKSDENQLRGKKEQNQENNLKRKSNETNYHESNSNVDKNKNQSPTKRDKRDFSVFLENDNKSKTDDTLIEESFEEPKKKRRKVDTSLNESVISDEEKHERRRHSAALYQKYLNRSAPKHLGSKEIPKGKPNCLQDFAFLLTGVLESFERDEVEAAITEYGGVVKKGISKKVTHLIAGDDSGPAKLAKALELGIRVITEDEFLKLIESSNGPSKDNEKRLTDEKIKSSKINRNDKAKTPIKEGINGVKKESSNKSLKSITPAKESKIKIEIDAKSEQKLVSGNKSSSKSKVTDVKKERKSVTPVKESKIKIEVDTKSEKKLFSDNVKDSNTLANSLMWVDKYKPQNLKQIIGQHGEASNVKKLCNWLTKWYSNRKAKLPKPSPWAKNDDGGYYKAALLSGPPGIGKTTTVTLVCKELGFDTVEFNASDTRSKTLIRGQIGELLTTNSLSGYAKGSTGKGAVTKKHVLVMDEVDGMAGNEDRGGLQELISLIKSSSVPIICTCNDRNSEKMRTLVNYCYDLRFSRPRVDQIKSALMSICFKEDVKVPPDVIGQLVVAAGQDVRQALHLLSLWAAAAHSPDALRDEAKRIKKDVKMGPWEAIRKVFSAEEHKTMTINDKSDLFFTDYSLAPLFVQENYLNVSPRCPKHEVMQRMRKAADSLSWGDIVDAKIRSNQSWNLLPVQAMFSSVIPGHTLAGHVAAQIQFPGWLGKNSRANKMRRLCQEIHAHTRLSTSGSKSSIFLDYASYLRDAIVNPLVKDRNDGIQKSLEVLESYHLLRDDLESLTELSLWPGQRNPMILIDSKVKAAMTRTYNKTATALPYAPGAVKKAKHNDEETEESQPDNEANNEDSDPENDALIKKKKKEDKPSTSKGKSNNTKEKKKKK